MQFNSDLSELKSAFLTHSAHSNQTSSASTPGISTLFVEHLTNIDFSFIDEEHGLSGQSWVIDLELQGNLNDQGMLLDFGDIKKSIKADIEALWDHKLLVPAQMNNIQFEPIKDMPGTSCLQWQDHRGLRYRHRAPDISVYQVQAHALDKGFLEQHLQAALLQKWHSDQIQDIRISMRQEQSEDAYFQYSHGLRLHDGACQRIAHGHRSKLKVITAEGVNSALSQALASQIQHAYFVDRHNIQSHTDQQIQLSYTAPEGYYELNIPTEKAVIMTTETTIENIAAFLLSVAQQHLSRDINAVQAYEGWQKGAIAARGDCSTG